MFGTDDLMSYCMQFEMHLILWKLSKTDILLHNVQNVSKYVKHFITRL